MKELEQSVGMIQIASRMYPTQVKTEILRDPNLSMQAKGLYAYLETHSKSFKIYKSELQNHFSNGKDAVRNAFDELVQAGYVHSIRVVENGKFKGWNHILHDTPCENFDEEIYPNADLPLAEKPMAENPTTENPPLRLINNKVNQLKVKEKYKKGFDELKLILDSVTGERAETIKKWYAYKIERKDKVTASMVKTWFKKFSHLSNIEFETAVDHSISSGWSGIFPPKHLMAKAQTTADNSERIKAEFEKQEKIKQIAQSQNERKNKHF
jgi:hypothetical protein